jgi:hypothetical protein
VTAQSMGPMGLDERLLRMGERMIRAHTRCDATAGPVQQ